MGFYDDEKNVQSYLAGLLLLDAITINTKTPAHWGEPGTHPALSACLTSKQVIISSAFLLTSVSQHL